MRYRKLMLMQLTTIHFEELVTNHYVLIIAQNDKSDKQSLSTTELDQRIVDHDTNYQF